VVPTGENAVHHLTDNGVTQLDAGIDISNIGTIHMRRAE
jgi:F420-0:gamma-glutamyl ligase